MSFGRFDLNTLGLANRHELPLFAIIGVRPRDRDPIFRYIGPGHGRWAGRNYEFKGVGEKVENLADKDYGEWVAGFYRSIVDSGQPHYDLVTAAMGSADDPAEPLRTVRYQRLLLPWKTPSDEVFVTSCSKRIEEDGSANFAADEDSSVIE